jgi:hypothetical protein
MNTGHIFKKQLLSIVIIYINTLNKTQIQLQFQLLYL